MKSLVEFISEDLEGVEILTEGRIADIAIEFATAISTYIVATMNNIPLVRGSSIGPKLINRVGSVGGPASRIVAIIISIAFEVVTVKGIIDSIRLAIEGDKDDSMTNIIRDISRYAIIEFMRNKQFNQLCQSADKYPELVNWLEKKSSTKTELEQVLKSIDIVDLKIIKELVEKFWNEFKYQSTKIVDVKDKSVKLWDNIKNSIKKFFDYIF